MYISDDHIFYGSLSLAFLAFLTILVTMTETHSIQRILSAPSNKTVHLSTDKTDMNTKVIQFRKSLNTHGSRAKLKVAKAIIEAGHHCSYMGYIKPMALSGIYQATCFETTAQSSELKYIYNVKSGFVHKL